VAERHQQDAADNCVACHMPRGGTDVAHVAFTDHRIRRPGAQPPADPDEVPEVVPIYDVAHLPAPDRDRNLGLAYLTVAADAAQARYAEVFRKRALHLIEAAYAAGLRDGELVAARATLAEHASGPDRARARRYLEEMLRLPGAAPDKRAHALQHLANEAIQGHEWKSAIGWLEEATQLRRYAADWHLLGIAYLRQGQPLPALQALQRAVAIRPFRPQIHLALAEAYDELHDTQHASEHRDKARWLMQHEQD
jgi:tetratricopeptide (TPR) repeat protein